MKHPTDEQWIDWLYGEQGRDQRRALQAHRDVCPQCDQRLRGWENTRRRLDGAGRGFGLETSRPAATGFSWVPRLAAAALILILGLGTGWLSRASVASRETRALQAEMEARWAHQLGTTRAEILAQVTAESEASRAEDMAVFLDAIADLRAQYGNQLATLREDLEMIALNTEASFSEAGAQLFQIAQEHGAELPSYK